MGEGNGKFLFIVCGVLVLQDEMSLVDDGGDGKTTMRRQLRLLYLRLRCMLRSEVKGRGVQGHPGLYETLFQTQYIHLPLLFNYNSKIHR